MAKAGVVYLGTSEGLVVYSDPGGTGRWRRVAQSIEGQAVRAILAADALTLLVVVDGGALRSADGGQSWSAAQDADAEALLAMFGAGGLIVATAQGPAPWQGEAPPAPDPAALALLAGKQEVLIAAIAGGATLVRSEDSGATWAPAAVEGALDGQVRSIAPASYHMDIVWAGTDTGQVLRSDDRGRTWHQVAHERAGVLSMAVVRLA